MDKEATLLALSTASYGNGRTIVFFATKVAAHRSKLLFGLAQLPAAAELHGNMSQTGRLEALDSFRKVPLLSSVPLQGRVPPACCACVAWPACLGRAADRNMHDPLDAQQDSKDTRGWSSCSALHPHGDVAFLLATSDVARGPGHHLSAFSNRTAQF